MKSSSELVSTRRPIVPTLPLCKDSLLTYHVDNKLKLSHDLKQPIGISLDRKALLKGKALYS